MLIPFFLCPTIKKPHRILRGFFIVRKIFRVRRDATRYVSTISLFHYRLVAEFDVLYPVLRNYYFRGLGAC